MTERNIHEELLNEVKTEHPAVEGFVFLSEDPLKNLIYTDVDAEGQPACRKYKILLGGNPDAVQDIVFQKGNPAEELNGITAETLIDILFSRILKVNETLPHWHNNLVIDGLSLAANALNKRNSDRIDAGVVGTDKALPRQGTDDFHPIVRRLLTNQHKFNFILMMMAALSESYNDIIDHEAQADFIENTPEGPKRLVETTPQEDEAITLGVASAQKLLAVIESNPLFQVILGTMVHGKKLMGESARSDTTATAQSEEQPSASTTEQM